MLCSGIRRAAYDILVSYLSERKQFVGINRNKLQIQKTKYGVQQGSILGPLLFNLFFNDIPKLNVYLYADDTAIKTQTTKSILIENHEKASTKPK